MIRMEDFRWSDRPCTFLLGDVVIIGQHVPSGMVASRSYTPDAMMLEHGQREDCRRAIACEIEATIQKGGDQ